MSPLQNPKIAQLILAAGASTRMGEPKQLLPWQDTTLIGHAINQSQTLENTDTFVVLGAYYELIQREINHFSTTILRNMDWKLGMGSSIRYGVKNILDNKDSFDAILISLIDQPLIEISHYQMLIDNFLKNPESIVASNLHDRVGVPAIFPKSIFEELMMLKQDYGARYIIQKYEKQVKAIPLADQGIDIDTKQQYQKVLDELSD